MNKQKGIIIGILVLAVTMMVGYAIFSETITISGTATAKGNFDMTITCEPGLTNGLSISDHSDLRQDNNYKNDKCETADNSVTYDVELNQPGAVRNFTVKIENTGSIPATWNAQYDITKTSCKGDYSTGTFENCVDGAIAGNDLNQGPYVLAVSDGTNIYKATDEKILDFMDNSTGLLILKPGESIYLAVMAEWNINGIGGTSGESQSGTLFKENTTIKFKFNQVTN